jgi:glutathione S-transferase
MAKVVGSVSFGCSRNWEWLIGCARSICSLSRMIPIFLRSTPPALSRRNARVTSWALETFHSRLGLVIQRLSNCPFLAGDQFTAADISVSYALLLGLRTSNYIPGSVERAYLARTTTRPAYARAMETCQATKAWAEGSPTL